MLSQDWSECGLEIFSEILNSIGTFKTFEIFIEIWNLSGTLKSLKIQSRILNLFCILKLLEIFSGILKFNAWVWNPVGPQLWLSHGWESKWWALTLNKKPRM